MKHSKQILIGIIIALVTTICYAKNLTIGETKKPSLAPMSKKLAPAVGKTNQTKPAPMLKKFMPTVVNIFVRGEMPPGSIPAQQPSSRLNQKFEELGSGVIIDAKNGYIVTNAHVIKNAQSITITLSDGRSLRAKIIGYDPLSDLAVLQITAKRLKSASFGDSDKLQIGDSVYAIGSPFGLQQTVTSGVVSALERSEPGIPFDNLIQTDASINMGSSGGALANTKGELVGINTMIIAPLPISSGIGLAIPSNVVKNIANQLINYGKVRRGFMGVLLQKFTPALAEAMKIKEVEEGALVSQVLPRSPAEKAGLHSKDVVIKIMGKSVHSAAQVRNIASLLDIGSEAELQILRDNKKLTIKIPIIDQEEFRKISQEIPKNMLSGLILKKFNHLVDNKHIKGIEVLYVDDSSVAFSCGLMPGDVILAATSKPVTTLDQLQTIANKNPKQLLLKVKRSLNGNVFLVLEE